MDINKIRKVHCLFEQSGTFKNEFIKLGIPAEDYDIQNNFGQTDHIVDLFAEIEKAFEGGASLFDNITQDDLIFAFFPCIYFENIQMLYFSLENLNNRKKDVCGRINDAIERLQKRTIMHELLYKLYAITSKRNIPLIIENPYSELGYLTGIQNFPKPQIIDRDRTRRGDYFVKPTAFWFLNCEPTEGFTYEPTDKSKIKKINECAGNKIGGVCNEERSMITANYARNFICDNIFGIKQDIGQLSLF